MYDCTECGETLRGNVTQKRVDGDLIETCDSCGHTKTLVENVADNTIDNMVSKQ